MFVQNKINGYNRVKSVKEKETHGPAFVLRKEILSVVGDNLYKIKSFKDNINGDLTIGKSETILAPKLKTKKTRKINNVKQEPSKIRFGDEYEDMSQNSENERINSSFYDKILQKITDENQKPTKKLNLLNIQKLKNMNIIKDSLLSNNNNNFLADKININEQNEKDKKQKIKPFPSENIDLLRKIKKIKSENIKIIKHTNIEQNIFKPPTENFHKMIKTNTKQNKNDTSMKSSTENNLHTLHLPNLNESYDRKSTLRIRDHNKTEENENFGHRTELSGDTRKKSLSRFKPLEREILSNSNNNYTKNMEKVNNSTLIPPKSRKNENKNSLNKINSAFSNHNKIDKESVIKYRTQNTIGNNSVKASSRGVRIPVSEINNVQNRLHNQEDEEEHIRTLPNIPSGKKSKSFLSRLFCCTSN